MDDEDIADAEDAKQVQNTNAFSGLGSTQGEMMRPDAMMDVLKTTGETMGVKLLKKMGWRDGQGVGPKVRRKARLSEDHENGLGSAEGTHLFAPENSKMISFNKKNDRKGLGYECESRSVGPIGFDTELQVSIDGPLVRKDGIGLTSANEVMKAKPKGEGGFGIGILNDNGSDDEDPYAIGPQISYNRVVGGSKKKKKKPEVYKPSSNPLLTSRPVFISKKLDAKKKGTSFRRCHDGRLPLDGFVLGTDPDRITPESAQENRYPAPDIPTNWKSAKSSAKSTQPATEHDSYRSSATVAAASKLSPKSRAALLGETLLPGKSVFDYLTPNARTRIASATGNDNLPAALGEASAHKLPQSRTLLSLVPLLSSEIAVTALGRGTAGWMPYAEDLSKRARYRKFLEIRAGLRPEGELPDRANGATNDEWVTEMNEFAHAAQIFKPMTGTMATRFMSSSSAPRFTSDNVKSETSKDMEGDVPLLQKNMGKTKTPAEEAAAVGMYGPLTRSMQPFYPSRLLCKRFNIKPPVHVQADSESSSLSSDVGPKGSVTPMPQPNSTVPPQRRPELLGKEDVDHLRASSINAGHPAGNSQETVSQSAQNVDDKGQQEAKSLSVDPERNEALEKERPGEAVFRAIFGSDSDDD